MGEEGNKPSRKHHIQYSIVSAKNERTDAERDGRTRLAIPNYQGRTGTGDFFPFSADHEQDWQPYPTDVQFAKFDDYTLNKKICTGATV